VVRIAPSGGLQALVVVWLGACVLGMWVLLVYSNTPGPAGEPEGAWTLGEAVPLDPARQTLVLYAHPKCPCTLATMSELERLQRRSDRAFTTRVIFYEPADAGPGWRDTHLGRRARGLPRTTVHPDPGGRLIRLAGAKTSGTAALHDPDGALRYWGGLTLARGHEGDSVGSLALLDHLEGRGEPPSRCNVFGCALLTPDPEEQTTDAEPTRDIGRGTD